MEPTESGKRLVKPEGDARNQNGGGNNPGLKFRFRHEAQDVERADQAGEPSGTGIAQHEGGKRERREAEEKEAAFAGADVVDKKGSETGKEAAQLAGVPKCPGDGIKAVCGGKNVEKLPQGDEGLQEARRPKKSGERTGVAVPGDEVKGDDNRPRGENAAGEVVPMNDILDATIGHV